MKKRFALGLALAAGSPALMAPVSGSSAPLQPACVVVDAGPVHLRLGYAPNGPEDCTVLPPA